MKKIISSILLVVMIMSVAVIPCSAAIRKGDINGDGRISAADARLALRYAAKIESLTADQVSAAEVNQDNKITAADARKILRVSAKLETEASLSGELPIIPPHFDELSKAFGATFGSEFDYKKNDATYVVFNILTNDFVPLGYINYSEQYQMLENYSDPAGKFRYCFRYSINALKWICEDVYNVDFTSFVSETDTSYSGDGYFYRECVGPTGLEETYSAIIKNYSIDASGRYNMNVYYVCEYPGGMDILGEYNIVADWVDENEGYWSFYSVKKL